MNEEKFGVLFKHTKYGPSQHEYELRNALNIIAGYSPSVIAEIGTYAGGTLRFWRELIPEDGLLISVDLNDRGLIPEVMVDYASDDRVKFVIGDSMTIGTEDSFVKAMGGKLLDVLFIDACHEYEYVRNDIKIYSKYIKSGGLLILHDIIGTAVGRAWRDCLEEVPYVVKIELFGKVKPCGIGILEKC